MARLFQSIFIILSLLAHSQLLNSQQCNPSETGSLGSGICINLSSCQSLLLNSSSDGSLCNYPAVCCYNAAQVSGNITPAPAVQNVCGVPRSGTSLDGNIGADIISPRDEFVRSPRIMGGSIPVSLDRYCSTVAIYANNQLSGSGILINALWVATSVNVVQNYINRPNQLSVRFGVPSGAVGTSTPPNFTVSSVKRNPAFATKPPGYPVGDLALLQLSTAVDFGQFTNLCGACLPNISHSFIGERCHVAGYGSISELAAADGTLREVLVPVIPRDVCDIVYRQVFRNPTYNTDPTSICAGGEHGKDTCSKDGGAPLLCNGHNRNVPVVAGLSSWGIGCGRSGIPSIYTSLSNPATLQFIQKTTGFSFPYPTSWVTSISSSSSSNTIIIS